MLLFLLFRISEEITVLILFTHTYFCCSIRAQIRVYKYVSIVMTTVADITSDAQTTSVAPLHVEELLFSQIICKAELSRPAEETHFGHIRLVTSQS